MSDVNQETEADCRREHELPRDSDDVARDAQDEKGIRPVTQKFPTLPSDKVQTLYCEFRAVSHHDPVDNHCIGDASASASSTLASPTPSTTSVDDSTENGPYDQKETFIDEYIQHMNKNNISAQLSNVSASAGTTFDLSAAFSENSDRQDVVQSAESFDEHRSREESTRADCEYKEASVDDDSLDRLSRHTFNDIFDVASVSLAPPPPIKPPPQIVVAAAHNVHCDEQSSSTFDTRTSSVVAVEEPLDGHCTALAETLAGSAFDKREEYDESDSSMSSAHTALEASPPPPPPPSSCESSAVTDDEQEEKHRDLYGYPIESANIDEYTQWFRKDLQRTSDRAKRIQRFFDPRVRGKVLTEKQLAEMFQCGIPRNYRARCWCAALRVDFNMQQRPDHYRSLVSKEMDEHERTSEAVLEIKKDVPRAFPTLERNRQQFNRRLHNVLLAYSRHNPSIGYCIPEDDHQVLTSRGFMFLHEIQELRREQGCDLDDPSDFGDLLIAGYNASTQQLVYESPVRIVVNNRRKQTMIEFTHHRELAQWQNPEAADAQCTRVSSNDDGIRSRHRVRSNAVSLLVTPEHQMYASRRHRACKRDGVERARGERFVKCSARSLFDLRHTRNASHRFVDMLSAARNGVYTPVGVCDDAGFAFARALDAKSCQSKQAFLRLYGYWLQRGWFKRADDTSPRSLSFDVLGEHSIQWINEQAAAMQIADRLVQCSFYEHCGEERRCISITHRPLVEFLFDQYHCGAIFSEDNLSPPSRRIDAPRCFASWVWHLPSKYMQSILDGVRRACSTSTSNVWHVDTPSSDFRDQLVVAGLHAGWSARFFLARTSRSVFGTKLDTSADASRDQVWSVEYSTGERSASVTLDVSRDLREVRYTGRTWCFQMPSGFIVTRRAVKGKQGDGGVFKASRAIISGNCQGMNFLAGVLLQFMEDERAFWALVALVEDRLPGYFTRDMTGVRVDNKIFSMYVNNYLVELGQHFKRVEFHLPPMTTEWFMCLFAKNLPPETAFRIWDAFIYRGISALFEYGIRILKYLEPMLLNEEPSLAEITLLIRDELPKLFDIDLLNRVEIDPPISNGAVEMWRLMLSERLALRTKKNKYAM